MTYIIINNSLIQLYSTDKCIVLYLIYFNILTIALRKPRSYSDCHAIITFWQLKQFTKVSLSILLSYLVSCFQLAVVFVYI